ncbi:hypothetical protein IPZ58_30930 [Streptomyces roseoverticillatus]|uniref:hypothetical protein n=1 Tax=Streptomyces roseoverticillatus TaxID=66429 RepID=UPI001F36BC08|nr:hypothetical protein [Streptomyces roseoverticillatus]MCF3105957.1 hypothetical protein [Streptomyces roseoverticillatus]
MPAKGREGSSAPAEGRPGTAKKPPVWVDATGLFSALPVEAGVGDIFVGGNPVVVQEGEALTHCSAETKSPCAGLQAAGKKEMDARGSADKTRLEFTLYTFRTEEEASRAMKDLAEQQRKSSAEDGTPSKPLTVDSGADETDAIQDGDRSHVVMRIGAVVAHVDASGAERGNVEHAAKVQVARVKSVAAGINPDR